MFMYNRDTKLQPALSDACGGVDKSSLSVKDFEVIQKLSSGVYLVHKKTDPPGTYYAMKVLEKSRMVQ